MIKINLPFQYVHDINKSFCFLLIPLGKGRWLAWATKRKQGFVIARKFHNCTASGVY